MTGAMQQGLNHSAYGLAILPQDTIFTSETFSNAAAGASPNAPSAAPPAVTPTELQSGTPVSS